jgi:hypothetical protein
VTEAAVSNFFRVDGADSETGQETFLVLRAKSKPHAERLARKQGLLIHSVRVAKKGDWEDAPATANSAPAVEPTLDLTGSDETPTENTTGKDRDVELEHKPLSPSAPLEKLPSPATSNRITRGTGTATFLLSCIGGALVVGGVLALTLALWPDDGVRNELQQIDFRLHELSEAVLGSTLMLGGIVVLFLAGVLLSTNRQ